MIHAFAPRVCCIAAAGSMLVGLSGCALPYLGTAQAAYRVDPVLVQWAAREKPAATQTGTGPAAAQGMNLCLKAPPDPAGGKNTSTPVDVLCPLDLDTYVFPQDLRKEPQKEAPPTAYARVLGCQEKVAPSEQGISLGREIDLARSRRDELQQRSAAAKKSIPVEEGILAERRKAQEDANIALAQAQGKLKSANAALASDNSADKAAAQEQAAKALADSQAAEKLKQASDADAARQDEKLRALRAEAAALPSLIKENAALLKLLEARVQKSSADPGSSAPTASLLEYQLEANCMSLRNQLQEEIIARSTPMCEKHLSDIEATASLFNATLGVGSLTQSALAAVVTGKIWSQALSTGAAITTGTQAVINKEIFRNAVVPAIKRAIKAERERRLNLMRANQLRPLTEYQAGRAVSEAAAYHEACSFSTGLELIGNDAEKRVEHSIPDIQARVKALVEQIATIDASISGASSEAERRSAERSKLRLRQEIDILQSRLAGARQGGN